MIARCFVCLYMMGDVVFTVIREGLCTGFLPLSRYNSALDEAKLRMVNRIFLTNLSSFHFRNLVHGLLFMV